MCIESFPLSAANLRTGLQLSLLGTAPTFALLCHHSNPTPMLPVALPTCDRLLLSCLQQHALSTFTIERFEHLERVAQVSGDAIECRYPLTRISMDRRALVCPPSRQAFKLKRWYRGKRDMAMWDGVRRVCSRQHAKLRNGADLCYRTSICSMRALTARCFSIPKASLSVARHSAYPASVLSMLNARRCWTMQFACPTARAQHHLKSNFIYQLQPG